MSFIFDPDGTPLEIRSPDFGNQTRVNNNDIRRFTRGGDTKVYASSDWAKIVNKTYTFSVIPNTVANNLIDDIRAFFIANAGRPVTITDHLGIKTTGFIVTPALEIIATRPDCSYEFSFEFMEEPT